MKSFIAFLLLFVSCHVYAQDAPINNDERPILIRGVNILPMDHEEIIPNQDILVHNGMIIKIRKTGRIHPGKNAVVIEAKGKYIIPGLAEMHAHVPPTEDENEIQRQLNLFLLHGITTIRGMLGHPKHLVVRAKVLNKELPGPRFYTSGPSFNGNSVKSAEEGKEMVRKQKQDGYDFLKIHPGLTRENFDAVAEQAVISDIELAGHVPFDVGIWRATETRYATIDHLDGFLEGITPGIQNIAANDAGLFGIFLTDKIDTTQFNRLAKALRQNHIWLVPTQALAERWMSPLVKPEDLMKAEGMQYIPAATANQWANAKRNFMSTPKYDSAQAVRYLELRRRLIKFLHENSVGILLGSDAPQVFNVPGISTHQELEYLVQAGISPYFALASGTVNVGFFFNNNTGIIREGKRADFLVLDKNPLENISNTRSIWGIMSGHYWLGNDYRIKMLKSLEVHP